MNPPNDSPEETVMTTDTDTSPWTEKDGELYLQPVDGPEMKITVRERRRWSEDDTDWYEMVSPDGLGVRVGVPCIKGRPLASVEDVYVAAEQHMASKRSAAA